MEQLELFDDFLPFSDEEIHSLSPRRVRKDLSTLHRLFIDEDETYVVAKRKVCFVYYIAHDEKTPIPELQYGEGVPPRLMIETDSRYFQDSLDDFKKKYGIKDELEVKLEDVFILYGKKIERVFRSMEKVADFLDALSGAPEIA